MRIFKRRAASPQETCVVKIKKDCIGNVSHVETLLIAVAAQTWLFSTSTQNCRLLDCLRFKTYFKKRTYCIWSTNFAAIILLSSEISKIWVVSCYILTLHIAKLNTANYTLPGELRNLLNVEKLIIEILIPWSDFRFIVQILP